MFTMRNRKMASKTTQGKAGWFFWLVAAIILVLFVVVGVNFLAQLIINVYMIVRSVAG